MSWCDEVAKLIDRIDGVADGIEPGCMEGRAKLPAESIRRLVRVAARLYADSSCAEPVPLSTANTTPTQAVSLAAALLRAHELSAFDLALWLSTQPAPRTAAGSPSETPVETIRKEPRRAQK